LRSYPAIHDVVIWNEANQTTVLALPESGRVRAPEFRMK
jgi:hypothetical protein